MAQQKFKTQQFDWKKKTKQFAILNKNQFSVFQKKKWRVQWFEKQALILGENSGIACPHIKKSSITTPKNIGLN